jgi:hypothetical protein
MGAVTYLEPNVSRLIEENFIPIQIDVTSETPESEEAIARYRQVWTPTIIVLDPEGQEVRRSQGYFPPEEFVAELKLGLGQIQVLHKNWSRAFEVFQDILQNHPGSSSSPEALYWMGVSAYKRDNNPDGLTNYWNELKGTFPDSPWWTKASFIAD